ncbi:hypothetical protein TNCV_677911 [Trichonephila clavipes]|nr:hypothetical protein TNCV_677911 [Trichonephila clavipes]
MITRGTRTHLVDEFLESEDIRRMDWPVRSPDLILIQHAWDALGRAIAARNSPLRTIQLKFSMATLRKCGCISLITGFNLFLQDVNGHRHTVVFSIAGYPRTGGNSQIGETSLFSTADCAKSTDYSSKDNPRILLADFGGCCGLMRTRPCVRPLRFSLQRGPRTGSKKVSVGVGKRENLAHSVTVK